MLDVSTGEWSLLFGFACNELICIAEGTEIWVTTENVYNERVARVENQIISRLRDRLGMAHNANKTFCVFSKFNALFV